MAKRKRSKRRRSLRGLGALGAVTKQDFIGVAGALCETGASDRTIVAVGDYFQAQNPDFKHVAFLKASRCGRR